MVFNTESVVINPHVKRTGSKAVVSDVNSAMFSLSALDGSLPDQFVLVLIPRQSKYTTVSNAGSLGSDIVDLLAEVSVASSAA